MIRYTATGPRPVESSASKQDLNKDSGARQAFTKKELEKLNITFFDTKEYLIRYSSENNIPISELYFPDRLNKQSGHLNELGNLIIAKSIVEDLERLD